MLDTTKNTEVIINLEPLENVCRKRALSSAHTHSYGTTRFREVFLCICLKKRCGGLLVAHILNTHVHTFG